MGAGINHDICASMVTNGSTALIGFNENGVCDDYDKL